MARDEDYPIEIIDIECVLLSFLSEKFVSTKQFWTEYIQKSSFKNNFSTLLYKPKQNPKDQDKLKFKLNRYVLYIFQLFYNINEVQ
jgi:hypothetical protein